MVVAIALIGAAMATPGVAAATPNGFFDQLDEKGVYYSSIFGTLDAGKGACQVMRAGTMRTAVRSVTDAIDYVWFRTNVTNSRFNAVGIVNAAAHHLCPDQVPKIHAHIHQP